MTILVKYGGNAMTDAALQVAFAEDIVELHAAGLNPVVVHGGGPQISTMLKRLAIDSEFIGGLRKTTPEVLDVVRMVLVGQVQRELVGLINAHGPLAVGLSGEDAGLFRAERRGAMVAGELVDIGLVGDVVQVREQVVTGLLDDGYIPVVSTLARGVDGQVYNVNADTAAAALAGALHANTMIVLTDVAGLYADWPASTRVIPTITAVELAELLPALEAGMVPKMEGCLRAVRGGVATARVIDGRKLHAVRDDVFGAVGGGTTVVM
ncbi:MAG: acetylglutamate kinase [Actinomycetota bacterium]|nr:acetylglutamate kinase [Actinomycetota bacterium]